ncbi:MAG TPA: hypothetical protein VGD91_22170, partial [Trebonia sp.]
VTALHAHGGRAELAAVLFILQELPFMIAALGLGHLLRGRFPKLSSFGAAVAVVGGFCDAIASAFTVVYVELARDPANHAVAVSVIRQAGKIEGLFSIAGAVGTVLGLVLLSVGLFRGRIGPRWVSPLLWAFLILQFVGSSVSAYASLTSVTIALIAYWALAATVWRTPATSWRAIETGLTPEPAAEAVPA